MAYDPVFTLLPLPGDCMDRRLGPWRIPASSISFANTFGVMASVAAWDLAVAPLARRAGRPISTTARIGYGYIVAFVAVMSGGRRFFGVGVGGGGVGGGGQQGAGGEPRGHVRSLRCAESWGGGARGWLAGAWALLCFSVALKTHQTLINPLPPPCPPQPA